MRFYRAVRGLFIPAGRLYFRMRVVGVEHVPATGPGIVAANHVSWLDPCVVGSACPRPIRFLIARSVYDKPWSRWFYQRMQTIPVENGEGDPRALRTALRALARGELVGVFPEGRGLARIGEAREPQPGALLLAALSGAPFVPVALSGTLQAWPPNRKIPRPRPVRVRFGEPFRPWVGDGRPPREEFGALSALVMERIYSLAQVEG